jgi:hypothetical protein
LKYTAYGVFLYLVLTLLRYRNVAGLLPNTVCTFFINIFSFFGKVLALMHAFLLDALNAIAALILIQCFFGKPHDGLIKFLIS